MAKSAAGVALLLAGAATVGLGQAPSFDHLSSAERARFQKRFEAEVWPLLVQGGKDGCVGCHTDRKNVTALRMSGDASKDFATLLRDGFFLADDDGSLLARIDLVPRVPRFREDQFQDLFREQPRPTNPRPPQPSPPDPTPAPTTAPTSAPASQPTTRRFMPTFFAQRTPVVFDGIRQRLTLLPVGLDVDFQTISPDGRHSSAADEIPLDVSPAVNDTARLLAQARVGRCEPGKLHD